MKHKRFKPPKKALYKHYKVFYLLIFVVSNLVFGWLIERAFLSDLVEVMYIVLGIIFFSAFFNFIGEIVYLLKNLGTCLPTQKSKSQYISMNLMEEDRNVITDY